jgi:arabinose-5-phosphate isomerase
LSNDLGTNSIELSFNFENLKQDAISILYQESNAIRFVAQNFPDRFSDLVKKIVYTAGKVVFSGCGKSGLVARKLVATFSSVGIPSIFLHPGDALHGDLGVFQSQDIFISISKSGTGKEIENIVMSLSRRKIWTSLICCEKGYLSDNVDLCVRLPFQREACMLNLAPTSSSTITMAFGDALAVVVSKIKGFSSNDFARFHPAGLLGKKLLMTVKTLMHSGNRLPLVQAKTLFKDVVYVITQKALGVGIITSENGSLIGLITDGDLRRACNQGPSVFDKTAEEIMNSSVKTIEPNIPASQALSYMENLNITSLVVVESGSIVGLLHIHDIVKTGIKE